VEAVVRGAEVLWAGDDVATAPTLTVLDAWVEVATWVEEAAAVEDAAWVEDAAGVPASLA